MSRDHHLEELRNARKDVDTLQVDEWHPASHQSRMEWIVLFLRGSELKAEWRLAVEHHHPRGWMADLLRYLDEPGENNDRKRPFAEQIRNFYKVNVNHFTKLWVVHDIAQWQYCEGREPGWD